VRTEKLEDWKVDNAQEIKRTARGSIANRRASSIEKEAGNI